MRFLKVAIFTVAWLMMLSPAANTFAADEVQIFHKGCMSGQAQHCNILYEEEIGPHVSVGDHTVIQPGGTKNCPIDFAEIVPGTVLVKQIEIRLWMALAPNFANGSSLEMFLNGVSLGALTVVEPTRCFHGGDLQQYKGFGLRYRTLQSQYFADGVPGFIYGGMNTLTFAVSGGAPVAIARPFDFALTLEKLNKSLAFDLTARPDYERRVLIHKYGDGPYPSPSQSEDRKITIEATVKEDGVIAANQTVYLRIKDPADTATYIPAQLRVAGDNRGGSGTLAASQLTSNASGRISTVLTVTDTYAGDNYEVIGSFQPAGPTGTFPCESTAIGCPRSGVLTAWKRVYLERKNMMRKGAYIVEDALPGDRSIAVSDTAPFAVGQRVVLVHGPRLEMTVDTSGPLPAPDADFFYQEEKVIEAVDTTVNPGLLVFTTELQAKYGPDRSFTQSLTAAGVPHLADGVGVITGNPFSDAYTANPAYYRSLFDSMFVEYVDAPQVSSVFPRHDPMTQTIQLFMARKWYENSVRSPGSNVANLPNHRQLLGSSEVPDGPNNGARLGATYSGGHNASWVMVKRIERAATQQQQPIFGLDVDTVSGEVTTHELVHQWNVNPGAAQANLTDGHCSQQDYRLTGPFCLMHVPFYDPNHNPEFADAVVLLHYVTTPTGTDSEYLTVRQRPEPVPVY